jgi:hypothetical protein
MIELLKKIAFHYKYLGRDKLEHFYTASIGMLIFSIIFNPIVASCIVASAALAKELVNDLVLDRGNPEVLDAVMSCLPIIIYWAIVLC